MVALIEPEIAPAPSNSLKWLKRLAPYLLLGPLSGFLVNRALKHFREQRPVLGSLYVIALAEALILLPIMAARVGFHYL